MELKDDYYIWNKADASEKLSDHFSTAEFSCQCTHPECVEQKVAKELIDKLELLRGNCGFPLIITSGFRCHRHELELGEAGDEIAHVQSQHELGRAADVRCNSLNSHELTLKAEPFFLAIGVGLRWCHFDLRAERKRRWAYSY